MKEEENKDEKPLEGEDVSKTGMDFGQIDGNGGSHTAVDGGEKDEDDDDDKIKDPLPGQGNNGPI